MTRNLATDADAVAAYDEDGSWGRMSEGWPETPYTPGKMLLCTKAHVVPYGQYVVVGTVQREVSRGLGEWNRYSYYDYSNAKIRVASEELKNKLEVAYNEMFVVCRRYIEADLSGDWSKTR